jgi:hypothetical protein
MADAWYDLDSRMATGCHAWRCCRMGQFSFYLLVPRHTPAYSLLAKLRDPADCSVAHCHRMGQFSFYLLVPRHTPAYSLLANAALCCRFGPPLAFNFMAALAMPPSPHHSWRVRT